MKIKKGTVLEVEITGLAFGGQGLARVDGLAVFVDQAVPGDQVTVRVFKKKKNYAQARTVELLAASPERIEPPCMYSGVCGGCKWQFLKYDRQLVYKRQHVVESLEHIGGISGVQVHATLPSPAVFGYRNKMEFSCSDRRWLLPEEMDNPDVERGFALGLHVPGTYYKVLDTRACLLQPDLGNRLLQEVREFIGASDRPVYGLHSHEGFWRFLMLRHSVARDQWMVNIVTAEEDLKTLEPLVQLLMARYPQVVTVVNNVTARPAGVAIGESEYILAGDGVIVEALGSCEFEISPNSFFQTNTRAAAVLYKTVAEYAGLDGSQTVLDLYSGTGTIPILLAGLCKQVIGIEIAASAVADAVKNCRRNQVSNCRFIQGDLRTCLEPFDHRPQVLIIDPPRTGMHPDTVKQVLKLGAERLVYVSCNPATLARDLDLMRERYRLVEIQPVDMFPHTHHIEAVAKLEKSGL